MQGPLLCEVAAYLAQCSLKGKEVARSCAAMAASWASQLQNEMTDLSTNAQHSSTVQSDLYSTLQTKRAIAHCCVVVCFGGAPHACPARPGGSAALDIADAAMLLLHQVQACLHSMSQGSGELHARLSVLTEQCSWVMASRVEGLSAAIESDKAILDSAVRAVFADLPKHCAWQPSDGHLGCYIAQAEGQVYSIKLCTGQVLRDGIAPGHLPTSIAQHSAYQQLFGSASFEVAQVGGGEQVFRTVKSQAGCIYTFQLQGCDLVIFECPVNPDTGEMQRDFELELLPCACLSLACKLSICLTCGLMQHATDRSASKSSLLQRIH